MSNQKPIIRGTERFNVVMQQYPLDYLVSKNRMAKYITQDKVKKFDKIVERKYGSKLVPQEFKFGIEQGRYEWDVFSKTHEALYAIVGGRKVGPPVVVNKITKGLQAGIYDWMPKGKDRKPTLIHVKDGRIDKTQGKDGFVIANPKAAGTEKRAKISGQAFYVGGKEQQWLRMRLKEQLLEYFTPRILQQLPAQIEPFNRYMKEQARFELFKDSHKERFIHLEYIFYLPLTEKALAVGNEIQDLDNHAYPYMKVFKDALQALGILTNDDPRYVRGSYARYVHVDNIDERRLEVRFHFCENEKGLSRAVYDKTPVDETDPL